MAEAVDLKSIQCGFESHWGYVININRLGEGMIRYTISKLDKPLQESGNSLRILEQAMLEFTRVCQNSTVRSKHIQAAWADAFNQVERRQRNV